MNSAAENDWRGPSISKVDAYRLLQQPPPLPAPPPYLSFPLKTNLNHHLHKDAVSSTETDGGGGGGRDQGPLVLVSKETPKLQNPGFSTSSHSSKLSRYKINNNSSNAYEDENKDGKKRKKQKTRRSNLLGDITTTATGCRHYPNYNKDSISSNNILPPSDPLDDFFNDSHTLISKFGFKPSAPPLFNDQFFAPTKTTCTPIHSSESSPRGVHCQQQSEGEATLSVLSKFGFRDPVSHSLTSPLLRLKTASVSATTATNEDVYHRSEEEEEKDAEMREEGVEENRVDNERADLSVMAHFDDDEDDRATLPYTGHSFVSKSESPYSVENGGTDGVDGGGVGGGYELRRNVLAVSFLKKVNYG